ncbi:unnamed protein product [Symbiodinium sp. CCMP2456]|nr:unnamed protein product [Symbiodinium sp. CCMP2456]
MGRPSVDRQPVIVQGPHHAPALLYVPGRILRTLTEAEDDIIRTGLFMPGTSFADSCQLTHEHAPLFLSIPPGTRNVGLFVPAPAFFWGYHVVWVPPGTDPATLPLPVRKGFTLIYPGGIEHGATVRHSRIGAPNTARQNSAGTGGTSLVQIQDERDRQAKRCKALIRAHGLPRDCGCQAGVPTCDGRPAVTDVTSHAYDGGIPRDAEIHGATLACAAKEGPASLRPPGRQPIPTPLGRRKLPAPAKDWSAPPATPSHLPGVRCLKLHELLPGATARKGPGKLLLGVDADMEQFLFAQFGLQCFDPDWEAVNDVPPCARRFLKNLPQLPPDTRPQAMQFYVDGSYYEHSKDCGWSICALALHQGLWTWVGHHTIRAQAAGSYHTLGAPVHSAYETELAAMAYTLAHCLSTDVPCAIGFDSTSAQAVASASCYDQQDSHLAQACRSMSHLLMLRDRAPLWMHVKAHSGHPLNEFVDAAAKSAARGEIAGQLPTALFEAQTSSTLAWLWAGSGLHPSVPAVLPNGALADADEVRPSDVGISDMCPSPPPLAANVSFDFRAATYNCLTLQSVSQQESLCSQFHRKGVAVVGLQETRTGTSGRSSNQHYHILHSPAADGQLGCQLWLSKSLAVARAGQNPVHWDGASMCIVCTTPRMLLATAKAGGITFAFAIAHSPTTKSGVTFCQKWWDSLHSALRRLPHNSVPMMFIDANAHNHDPVDHLVLRSDINVNQTGFAEVVRAHSFCASGYVDVSGAPFYTWQGPGNQKACLDYVCCPDSLRAGMVVEGPLLDFVGHVDHDHKPVLTRFAWKQAGSLTAKKPRLDVEVLRTPAGKAALQQVYRQVPRIDWAASVDEHAYILNAHIMRGLRHICPKLADRPRDPVTSDSTWQLIKDRRALRRVMHQVTDREEWQDYLVLLGEQVKDMTRLIRASAKDDAARALRHSFHEARSQGVEALHRLCRRISKIGRRYRAPALCPALRQENGTVEEDSFRVLGDHFAEAERATHTTAEAIDTRGASYAAQDFPVADCLSVAGLARAFSGLSTRRAVGWSSLPAEAYQVAPLEAAHQHVALLLKCQLRRQCPLIWRGGIAVPIPKPTKPPHTTAGWRSILLLEPGAKAVARALRADLLQAFDCVRQPAQGGSRPKNPLPVASAHVKGLIKRIADYKLCGGILFVDGQAAFYSLLREPLLGTASCSDQEFIHALADAVFTKEEDRMRFVIQAMGPGLLASAAVPSAVQRFVAACLDNTWYCVGREPGHFYLTRTGSVPGAPLADLLFQLAFGRVLADISERADALGIRPLCPTAPGGAVLPLPAPSWMDDVAFPVLADRPAELLEQAGCMVQEVDAALHRTGIKVNFAPGKTEFLPIITGANSRLLRQRWLCQQGANFSVDTGTGQVTVHLSERYTHLGSEVDATGGDLADLGRRRGLSRDLCKGISRLVRNPHLTRGERTNLVISMPIARLCHNSGLWTLRTLQEQRLYNQAYMEPWRRSFRALCGISSRGLDDDAVCACLGVLTSTQVRTADLLRYAGWLLADGSQVLRELWFDAGPWHQQILRALQDCANVVEGCSWDRLCADPSLAKQWASSFSRRCRTRAQKKQDENLLKWTNLAAARSAGVYFFHYKGSGPTGAQHKCPNCALKCKTAAALAAHMSKAHGCVARSTAAANGTRCEVCRTEFWSTKRLRDHLRRQPTCLRVWAESDLDSREVAETMHSRAWRPACKTSGPAPWWATLRPASVALTTAEASFDGLRYITDWLQSADNKLEEAQVHQLIAHGIAHHLTPEDMPVAVIPTSASAHGIAHCALFAAQAILARSAGSQTYEANACGVGIRRLTRQLRRVQELRSVVEALTAPPDLAKECGSATWKCLLGTVRLVSVRGLLISVRTVPAQASSCSASPGTRVTAWKLKTGERMEVLLGRAIGEDPSSMLEGPWPLIRDLCNSTSQLRLAS